jgi:hypothetical protein
MALHCGYRTGVVKPETLVQIEDALALILGLDRQHSSA